MTPVKERYEAMSAELEAEKLARQGGSQGKKQLASDIQKNKAMVGEIETELKKINRARDGLNIQSEDPLQSQINSLKEKAYEVETELRTVKTKLFEANRSKNQFES